MRAWLLSALVIATIGTCAEAQPTLAPGQARDFNPELFFPPGTLDLASITISRISGREVPMWSIALKLGCSVDDQHPDECSGQWAARMLRLPRSADSTETIEWREANLRDCPDAETLIGALNALNWVEPNLVHPPRPPPGSVYVPGPHLDTPSTTIRVRYWGVATTYQGFDDPGTPGEWATRLADALEPCWRATTAPPPWTRR